MTMLSTPKTSTTWMNAGYHQYRNLVGYFPQRGKTGGRDDQWSKRPDNQHRLLRKRVGKIYTTNGHL